MQVDLSSVYISLKITTKPPLNGNSHNSLNNYFLPLEKCHLS